MDEPSGGLAPIIIQWRRSASSRRACRFCWSNRTVAGTCLVDYVHVMSKGQVVYSARPKLWANDDSHSYLGI
jgi:ABC-type branched-subunit amino acid transport system ATPase component